CLDIVSEPAPRPDGVSLRVDYTILAPEGAELDIGNRNGNVWIGPGCGRVTVRGQNTDIGVEAPEGAVDAASTNGRIRVLDAQGDVNVTTANGNVYIHRRGAGSSHATTINGAIEMHVLTPSVGDADLNTQNGDITLVLCPGCQMAVEASTAHGAVRTEIPVDAADGVQRKNRINGRIGGGGPNFTLQTLNGDIRLRPGRRRW
ncbi:MAG TPA: DUF4097 family beta strand repeat protein, partial [Candidatus Hydrogenedentes bacterium]|nr:DUF4097 family beta strand repeat protein [Candidatus Hydrogenedentota bacterium]